MSTVLERSPERLDSRKKDRLVHVRDGTSPDSAPKGICGANILGIPAPNAPPEEQCVVCLDMLLGAFGKR